jgi:hypothetical protein
MRPKLADQVAKNNKNLFGFFIFVGSRLGLWSLNSKKILSRRKRGKDRRPGLGTQDPDEQK